MAASPVSWGAIVAFATQSVQGTVDSTLAAVGTPLDSVWGGGGGGDDGIILGTATAGTGETGITVPTLTRQFLEKPDEAGTFTKQANTFLKTTADSFQVAFEFKGNGETASTPASGEAKPFAGIDALIQMAGLTGANGTAPVYEYTPTAGTTYGTVKLWVAGQSFVFGGCVIETLALPFTGGDATIAVANIRVGWLHAQAEVALPTANYGNQATLSAPVLENAGYLWSIADRSAQNMEVVISNEIIEIPDMNVANTGIRLAQNSRTISVNGTVYQDGADDDWEYQNLIDTTGVIDTALKPASWRLGTAAGASDVVNGVLVEAENLQVTSVKYVDAGDETAVEIQSHCTTDGSGGDEFKLTFD